MNRAKIMLATIAVLASVGAALAFKAKNFSQMYCIRSLSGHSGPGACTAGFPGKMDAGITTYYCTTTTNPSNCVSGNVQCIARCKLTVEP